jgi:hypothetical protein
MTVIATPPGLVPYGQPAGRWVLFATVLGSALAFIDATVVNIALPRIGTELRRPAAVDGRVTVGRTGSGGTQLDFVGHDSKPVAL